MRRFHSTCGSKRVCAVVQVNAVSLSTIKLFVRIINGLGVHREERCLITACFQKTRPVDVPFLLLFIDSADR